MSPGLLYSRPLKMIRVVMECPRPSCLEDLRLAPGAVLGLHELDDLAHRGIGAHGFQHRLDEIRLGADRLPQAVHSTLPAAGVPPLPHALQPLDLLALVAWVDPQ